MGGEARMRRIDHGICHPERSALIRECESVRVVEGSLVSGCLDSFKREFRQSRVRDFWASLGSLSYVFGIGILRLRMGLSFGQAHASLRMTKCWVCKT